MWYSLLRSFRLIFLGTKFIMHTDHTTLRYMIEKKNAKLWLIQWVFLLQEFDIKVKDQMDTENQVAYHLSRLEESMPKDVIDINDAFPEY